MHNWISDDARLAVYSEMNALFVNIKLPRGIYAKYIEKYGVSKRTVRRIWSSRYVKRGTEQEMEAVRKNRKENCSRPRINEEEIEKKVSAVLLRLRRT